MKENIFKKMRLEAGLSQNQLGKKLGYSSGQFCYNWESGKSLPPPSSLRKLAKIFNIDAAVLIETYKAILVQKYSDGLDKKIGKVS